MLPSAFNNRCFLLSSFKNVATFESYLAARYFEDTTIVSHGRKSLRIHVRMILSSDC